MNTAASLVVLVIFYCPLFTNTFGERNDGTPRYRKPILRIISGELTLRDEFPFMTALGWVNNVTSGVDYLGGGMLIAPNFVLTAAHCVFLKGKLPNFVIVGGNSVNSSLNEEHRVKNFFIYPDYDDKQAYYDIALLQLEETSGHSAPMGTATSLAIVGVIVSCTLVTTSSGNNEDVSDRVYHIIGGKLSQINEFPFMTALGWTNNATGEVDYLGGGMLIAPNFVLTAAHCVLFKGKLPNKVIVGGNMVSSALNEEHEVKNFFIYPDYDDKQAYYDIALLQLEDNSGKPPVCLWTKPTLYTKNVTAMGYGVTQFAGLRSADLQKVNLVVFPEKVCKPFFRRKRKFRSGIVHSHLCAGDPEGRRDTCQGDSGGPLIVDFKQQKYAAGITSTGQACSGFPPAIYTRISSYIGWIEEIVREHGYSIRKTCGVEGAE